MDEIGSFLSKSISQAVVPVPLIGHRRDMWSCNQSMIRMKSCDTHKAETFPVPSSGIRINPPYDVAGESFIVCEHLRYMDRISSYPADDPTVGLYSMSDYREL